MTNDFHYQLDQVQVCVIGLGYVGLPLARLFSTKFKTIGFDISRERVDELNQGRDHTFEVDEELIKDAIDNHGLEFTNNLEKTRNYNFYIVAVPTPVDYDYNPDFRSLVSASGFVGKVINKGDIVVYESTVYPGVTEEICIPIIEKESGLRLNEDFYAGYSPERINPGDKMHPIDHIKKITSGSTPQCGQFIDDVYKSVIKAGTHLASSIRIAEAAKVIENGQRDINIAYVNELSKIFHLIGIDTLEVLEAAETKWNFLPFKPGLVGGHCVGVDSYYLAEAAKRVGYHPEIILAGRKLNNSMSVFVASETVKLMLKKGIKIKNADVLILGFTFKENCPDVRNTLVVGLLHSLQEYGLKVTIFDPLANPFTVKREYGLQVESSMPKARYDACIIAVAHDVFKSIELSSVMKAVHVVFDVKGLLDREKCDGRL